MTARRKYNRTVPAGQVSDGGPEGTGDTILWFSNGAMRPHRVTQANTWPNGRVGIRAREIGGNGKVDWTGEPGDPIQVPG
jgi:hypothetical protein